MIKQKLLKTGLALSATLSLFNVFMPKINYAAVKCNSISESDVKYVDATLADINGDIYNAQMRGLSWEDYSKKQCMKKLA